MSRRYFRRKDPHRHPWDLLNGYELRIYLLYIVSTSELSNVENVDLMAPLPLVCCIKNTDVPWVVPHWYAWYMCRLRIDYPHIYFNFPGYTLRFGRNHLRLHSWYTWEHCNCKYLSLLNLCKLLVVTCLFSVFLAVFICKVIGVAVVTEFKSRSYRWWRT
jgi:hypothetical protein